MRALLPLVLAGGLALPVGLVASSVDERYEATASARIQPLVSLKEVDRLRATAGLPRLDEDSLTPFLPGGRAALERVVRRGAGRLGLDPPDVDDDLRVIDSARELVFPKYMEPVRRLKVKVKDEDPTAAARLASVLLSAYLQERERDLATGLREARDTLTEATAPRLRRATRPLRLEAAEAADIAIRLGGGPLVTGRRPAAVPQEPILPDVVRDTIVAALIGGLIGLLLMRRRGRPQREVAPAASAS